MTSERYARNALIELTKEYAEIMRNHIPGDRKELLENLLLRVRQAKQEYVSSIKQGEESEKP